jgi:hypothetical protein
MHYSATDIEEVTLPHYGIKVYRCELATYSSEEGYQIEFVVEAPTKDQAEDIRSYWFTNPRFIRSVLYNVRPFIMPGEEDPDEA